ncbi:hypothetical protein TNIN_412851 [Trichonephila inaurata madagascariensis]|uniref:Uncharacterized protein n=1 Tax=Trichonephila inaurata madagascariensis TaxID=2747483 RepID=A0A8X6YEC8_9ARAC|nr:hypothetical protein TNIN_412851 [Trichonephila inaurata madagascariensis]
MPPLVFPLGGRGEIKFPPWTNRQKSNLFEAMASLFHDVSNSNSELKPKQQEQEQQKDEKILKKSSEEKIAFRLRDRDRKFFYRSTLSEDLSLVKCLSRVI